MTKKHYLRAISLEKRADKLYNDHDIVVKGGLGTMHGVRFTSLNWNGKKFSVWFQKETCPNPHFLPLECFSNEIIDMILDEFEKIIKKAEKKIKK